MYYGALSIMDEILLIMAIMRVIIFLSLRSTQNCISVMANHFVEMTHTVEYVELVGEKKYFNVECY